MIALMLIAFKGFVAIFGAGILVGGYLGYKYGTKVEKKL
jgi:hypothetical protein